MTFDRWCAWLLYSSVFFAFFGVTVALAPGFPFLLPWTAAVDAHFFPHGPDAGGSALRAFMMAPLGGTIAAYYLLQSLVVAHAFRAREKWAWRAILWSTLIWFVVDSGMSALHGAYFNIYLINIFPLLIFGIPLYATRDMAQPVRK